jgi:hypothetical protein
MDAAQPISSSSERCRRQPRLDNDIGQLRAPGTLLVSDSSTRWTGQGHDFELAEAGFAAPAEEVGT